MMKKIFKSKIFKFMNKFKVTAEGQFVLREGLSTNNAMLFFVVSLHKVLDD